jgi:hypothetical protein
MRVVAAHREQSTLISRNVARRAPGATRPPPTGGPNNDRFPVSSSRIE